MIQTLAGGALVALLALAFFVWIPRDNERTTFEVLRLYDRLAGGGKPHGGPCNCKNVEEN